MRNIGIAGLAMVAGIWAATPALAETTAPPSAQQPPAGQALTAEDLSAFMDGFMPYAVGRANIAGAEVVVVKDGRVLFAKGYGVADVKSRRAIDPATTLFRPGSISKLFTWTAAMQLVEQGKLDLDKDVNTYLDFKIPEAFGKPITLRNLMTHTPGFEETLKNLITLDAKKRRPLGDVLKAWVPERIFPPGEVSAYSNYGAALTGYIVQRVSGEPFEQYVANHIFKPLGMMHSSFEQPLPKALAGDMSKGYDTASGKEIDFELVDMSPAGALSTTGADISKFMIAHLNDGTFGGAQILKPETARLMHSDIYRPVPSLPAMGLGFYHEDINGYTIVGHAGDTQAFHSDLHLILGQNVGLYYSQNSAGKPGTGPRAPLFEAFMNRYFPAAPLGKEPTLKTAKTDAARVAGHYVASRRSESNFLRAGIALGAVEVTANDDGTIQTDLLNNLAREPRKWREVAPGKWREVNGTATLVVTEKDGAVTRIDTDLYPPIMVISPATFWQSPTWQLPLLLFSLAMLALTVLFWPIKALLRWRYASPFPLSGRSAMLYRLTRLVALIDLAFLGGWACTLAMGGNSLAIFTNAYDPVWRVFQVLGVIGLVGTIFPLLNVREAFGDPARPWWTKLTDVAILVACIGVMYFGFAFRMFNLTLNY